MTQSPLFDPRPKGVEDILENHEERLAKTEQMQQAPSGLIVNPNFPGPIKIGPIEVFPDAPTAPIPAPGETGLKVTSGIYLGIPFIDIEWGDPGDGTVNSYDVEVAEKIAGVYQLPSWYTTAATNYRVTGLQPNTTYGAHVKSKSRIGEFSTSLPVSGYEDVTTPVDTTLPAQVTGVTLARGATTLVVYFNPNTDFDVKDGKGLYRVQVDTNVSFATSDLHDVTSSATVVAISDITGENANWRARVRAIDSSGNEGPWSTIAGPVTAGGVVDTMVVAGLNAAKITFGTMSGDRITTNTLDAATIKTSALTAGDITLAGGSLRASFFTPATTTGIVFNSSGIRAFKATAMTMDINAITGDATFHNIIATGTLETANSGQRVQIGGSGAFNQIRFFSGHPAEFAPGLIETTTGSIGGGFNYAEVLIRSPLPGFIPYSTISLRAHDNLASDDQTVVELQAALIGLDTDWIRFGSTGEMEYKNDSFISRIGVSAFSSDGLQFINLDGTIQMTSPASADIIIQAGDDLTLGSGDIMWIHSSNHLRLNGTTSIVLNYGATHNITFNTTGTHHAGDQIFMPDLLTASGTHFVVIDGTGQITKQTSSRRWKQNIVPMVDDELAPTDLDLYRLIPSRYNPNDQVDDPSRTLYGLIAEEVAEVREDLIIRDDDGIPLNVHWPSIWAVMIHTIQTQDKRIRELEG